MFFRCCDLKGINCKKKKNKQILLINQMTHTREILLSVVRTPGQTLPTKRNIGSDIQRFYLPIGYCMAS